jgi:predicted signal transduction protein with EAL and GGDEF domain
VTGPADNRLQARNDLAWAISVGGIGVVLFAALLAFTWHFATTLFLIFSGILLGVALNAMSNLLGRVVRMPHALRLTVVAEGVETQGQRDVLLRLGCDELQGFFYARPMRANAVLGWSLDEAAGLAPAA